MSAPQAPAALPDYLAGVRQATCPLCWARPGEACQQYYPPADHLARWLGAFDTGYVAEAHLLGIIGRLTVIAGRVLVREDVAAWHVSPASPGTGEAA